MDTVTSVCLHRATSPCITHMVAEGSSVARVPFLHKCFDKSMEDEKGANNIGKSENDAEYRNICDEKVYYKDDNKLSELNPCISKRQLKRVKRREKWLEGKVERRFLFVLIP